MFAAGTVRVAAVPNAWVNDDLPELGSGTSFEQIVSEMALAGYAGTELGSTYPTDAAVLNAALGVRGLSPSGGWVSTWFASKGGAYEQTLQTFRDQIPFFNAIGLKDVYVAEVTGAVHQQPVPALANRPVFDDEQWGAMVRGLGEMGRIAADVPGLSSKAHVWRDTFGSKDRFAATAIGFMHDVFAPALAVT